MFLTIVCFSSVGFKPILQIHRLIADGNLIYSYTTDSANWFEFIITFPLYRVRLFYRIVIIIRCFHLLYRPRGRKSR